jgi:tetratricopeptide (TPR) repeat protein
MRKRPLALLAAVTLLAILLALLVRVEPRGTATIFRRGDRITFRTAQLYIRPIASDSRCTAVAVRGRPAFDDTVVGRSATYDEFPLRVRFTYDPPPSVPADWPKGDWCTALRKRVAASALAWSAATSAEELLDRRRAAGDRAASAIESDLRAAGLALPSVSARVDLPEGFERVRNVPDVASRARRARPVIFIGLDGADWELLDGYMASGAMPNLRRLVRSGSGGVLLTEHPPLSPIVWTTMMTGVGPLEHGILDFARFNPRTHEKEPITSDERRAPAVWNMLTAGGKSVAVFGLWATYAAEPVHGVNVSDRLFTFLYNESERPPGAVYPPVREPWAARGVGAAERGVDLARMRGYLPSLTDAEFSELSKSANPYAEPPAALRRILVETDIYHRLAADLLKTRLPDVTIAYFQGTDTVGHVFAPFAPPKQPSVAQTDYDRYHDVPEHYFRDVDAVLGDFIGVAERAGAVIAIASDHGFHWKEGRPTQISSTATATAAKWHRNEGIYLLWGPGIAGAPNRPLRGGVRQVAATLLALAGMPAPKNGIAPLPGAPPPAAPADYAKWFTRAAPPPAAPSPRGSEEEIAKLRALGYIGSNESARSAVPQNDSHTAGWYNNEGLTLREEHRIDEALAAFRRAEEIDPKYASAKWNESQTLSDASRDLGRADALLVDAMTEGLTDATKFIITRAIQYQRSDGADRALRLLDAAVSANGSDGELRMFRGRYRMDRRDCAAALDDFRVAEQFRPNDPLAFASAGLAQMCLGDEAGARESFRQSLQLDPNQPMLRQVVGQP